MSNLEPPSSPTGASPTRGSKRHQIKRSLSEFTSPTRTRTNASQRKEQQQHHQPEEKRPPLPSHVTSPMRHSLDMPRTDFPSAIFSPDPSRRGSVLVARDDHDKSTSRDRANERVAIPRQMASDSAETLTQSLVQLNAFSTKASQRLDEAYYTVLEKVSSLQNTVMALKELADSSKNTCDTFDKETRSMENEIARQLGSVGHFQSQQSKISSLRTRIEDGRKHIESLNARVDNVRERVERWERADKQWQEKTRKKLKIIWSLMSVLTLILIILVWMAGGSHHPDGSGAVTPTNENVVHEPLNRSHFAVPPGNNDAGLDRKLSWKPTRNGDDRLHVFDEL